MRPSPSQINALLQSAIQLHTSGNLDQAAALYERVLGLDPRHPDALHLLGVVALRKGDPARAEKLILQAIKRNPAAALYHVNLGNALLEQGKIDQALDALRRALRLQPDSVEALNNLANALQKSGRPEEAVPLYLRAVELRPEHLPAYPNLAAAYRGLGQAGKAFDCYLAYLARNPDDAEILERLMDLALEGRGDAAAALRFREPYLRVTGGDARARLRLGTLLDRAGESDAALAHFRAAAEIAPTSADAQVGLGLALHDRGRHLEAIACFKRAAELAPNLAAPHSNMALSLAEMGRPAEAVQACRRALELEPDHRDARSNLVFFLHYLADASPRLIYEEHRLWERQHALAMPRGTAGLSIDRDPRRRLRVGYVSPDFRRHSVAYFLEPLLAAHDRNSVEAILYSDVTRPDEVTARLRAGADGWREVAALSDDELEQLIRDDRVDVLVDLAGHTARGRLGVFARKPAPVQVSYLGYPDTTGLRAMDYRISDAVADPEGEADALHAEKLLRLPRVFLAYGPDPDSPDPERKPADPGRPFTFASFNNLAKTTPELIALWARILRAVPGSRLMLKAVGLRDPGARDHLLQEFGRCGVGPGRLLLVAPQNAHAEHLARYRDADLCLDTSPYNGTTTTCEALWMGVPVVTLRGATHASRVGASLLANLGLEQLVADSPDEYVAKAATLAGDAGALRGLAAGLRERMRASPLLDAAGLAAALECAYRQMW
ncbi:MAG TPA: tetratricopeptide repeat protein, partial [Burkholderiales bacterium]|nr:tetratricopeptide repeat protein [Burkholderiales bacterium]